jgi:ATP/maltotriose-dependent transcriptional regulator MalT
MRHATFFAALGEGLAGELDGPSGASAVARLEREEDNFGQALRWASTSRDRESIDNALRIAGALGWYWFLHGYPPEARGWFDALLAHSARPDTDTDFDADPSALALRARALNAAGFRATDHAEYPAAAEFHRRALDIWRRLGTVSGLVASLHGVGDTALWQGASEAARAAYEEGLALAKRDGTSEDVALFAFHLAQLWWLLVDLPVAEEYGAEALAVAQEANSTTWTPYALYVLGSIAHEHGDAKRAGALYREALSRAWEHHDRLCVRMALPGLAALATLEGDPLRALRLAGAASALEKDAGLWAFPPIRERHERWLEAARRAVDRRHQDEAWAEGAALTIDEVIRYALEQAVGAGGSTGYGPGVLSGREREVLGLVADGFTNREIAKALFVTEHTAKYHVASLFNKLGASSRAEAVARAVSLGLLSPRED